MGLVAQQTSNTFLIKIFWDQELWFIRSWKISQIENLFLFADVQIFADAIFDAVEYRIIGFVFIINIDYFHFQANENSPVFLIFFFNAFGSWSGKLIGDIDNLNKLLIMM